MKYLLTALLLSISPAIMADLTYMNQQMEEMKNLHQQQMLRWQQQQQDETRQYLQQQQEQKQSNIRRNPQRPAKYQSYINRLE